MHIRFLANKTQYRVIVFYFCDIRHAIIFKNELVRRWETVNVQFSVDPCAQATAPRVVIQPVTRPF